MIIHLPEITVIKKKIQIAQTALLLMCPQAAKPMRPTFALCCSVLSLVLNAAIRE